MDMESVFICAAIHSAVRVFTGEADEIAAQSFRGFCVKLFTYKSLYIPALLAERLRNFLQLPALAHIGLHKLIGLLVVGEAHIRTVPQELLIREAPADCAEQQPLCEGAGNREIRAGCALILQGRQPLLMVSG